MTPRSSQPAGDEQCSDGKNYLRRVLASCTYKAYNYDNKHHTHAVCRAVSCKRCQVAKSALARILQGVYCCHMAHAGLDSRKVMPHCEPCVLFLGVSKPAIHKQSTSCAHLMCLSNMYCTGQDPMLLAYLVYKLQDVPVPPAAPLGVVGVCLQVQPPVEPLPAGLAVLQQDQLAPWLAHRCHLLQHMQCLATGFLQ